MLTYFNFYNNCDNSEPPSYVLYAHFCYIEGRTEKNLETTAFRLYILVKLLLWNNYELHC